MVTKEDLRALSDTIHAGIRTEVTALKADITAHGSRIQAVETTTQATAAQVEASILAISRQGNMLLALRCQTEDLDNRGRRSNIHIRRLPEPTEEEDVEATRKALFQEIQGADAPESMEFEQTEQIDHAQQTAHQEISYA
ncbi:Hypothetical predicted protein, partial [Pelobates cultripes]